MDKLREYTVEALTVLDNGQPVEANCVDIAFINYGTLALIVNNNIVIPPPAVAGKFNMITISGNVGEIDKTKYYFRFAAGVGTKNAILLRRNYK